MIDFSNYQGAMDLPDPRDFTSEEVLGALPIIKLPQKVVNDITPYLNQWWRGACHDAATEVLTEDWWKYFSDITYSDKLWTVNPETSELYFEHPTNIMSYSFQWNMFVGRHNKLNFMVTPNHKMLVKRWDSKNNKLNNSFEFVEAQELWWYSWFMNRIKNTKKWNDYYIIPWVDNTTNSIQRIDKIISMDTWLLFLGIFIAEWTLCYDEKRKQYKVQIAWVKDRERDFIESILNEMWVQYTSLKDRFTFNDKRIFTELSKWFLWVKAPYKRVPKFVFQESTDNIKSFLLWHFMGDGTFSSGRNVHYTSSSWLADDLFTLIFLSWEAPYIKSIPPRAWGFIKGRQIISKHTSYAISENVKNTVALDKKEHLYLQYYDGIVYCAEVPTYHTLVTRREWTILISWNCTVFWSSWTWFETMAQILNSLWEKYNQPFDPWVVWEEALKRWASDTQWWYLQSAIQLLTDMKLIGGYIKIGDSGQADAYTIQYWMSKGYAVFSGSANGNWSKVIATGDYSESTAPAWHAFQLNGYEKFPDGNLTFHSPNSWGGVWDFWMNFEKYWQKLFTQYVIIPTSEIELLKEAKWKRKLELLGKANEYKIWDGKRGSDIATAFEISKMISNAWFADKTRGFYARLFMDKILIGKSTITIWNQRDALVKASEMEIALMFTRSVTRTPWAKTLTLTREQVAITIARDLL